MKVLQNIFSINNSKSHKIIRILGLKIKLRARDRYKDLEKHFNEKLSTVINILNYRYEQIKKVVECTSLDVIELHIVEHCNLNCYGCTHYAPIAKKEYLDIKEYEKDLLRLKELTKGDIKRFNILGGEPLLHPKCTEFLRLTRVHFPNSKIYLITNGLLLPQQNKSFYNDCSKTGTIVAYSEYCNSNIDYNSVIKKLDASGVKWQNYGKRISFADEKLDPTGTQDYLLNWLNCKINWGYSNILYLSKGKLYQCPQAAYIRHFNNFFNMSMPINKKDYIDIYQVKNTEEILKFLTKPTPFCSYCKTGKKRERPWKISEKKITEWLDNSSLIEKNRI